MKAASSSIPRSDVAGRQPLVAVLLAWAAGITADRYLAISLGTWLLVAGGGLLVWFAARYRGKEQTAAWLLMAATASAGGARHHCHWHLYQTDELGRAARFAPQPICLEAIALEGPRLVPAPPTDLMRTIPKGDETRLRLAIDRVRDGALWKAASGQALLFVEGHLVNVQAGDRLQVFAQLSAPEPPQNPGEFDFAAYHRADHRLCLLRTDLPDCVSVTSRGKWTDLRRALAAVRRNARLMLDRYLSPEHSGLAAALLLGARDEVSPDDTAAFLETGTIHLLAISGLHVGILARALLPLAWTGFLPRQTALGCVGLLTVLYAVLTDSEPPVIRATVLVLATCCGLLLYRRALAFNTLAAAAMIVLAINPADLMRTGAQLSFLAVATLAWLGQLFRAAQRPDPLDLLIAQTRPWPIRWMKRTASAVGRLALIGTAIWLVALPLVMYRFHIVSPIALIINLVAWIPVVIGLMSGFAVLLAGWLIPLAGELLGKFCDLNLGWLRSMIELARETPGAFFWVPGPALWWVLGFYALVGWWALWPRWCPPRRWYVTLLALWIGAAAVDSLAKATATANQPPAKLECTLLSVGHGTSVVLELPGGQTLLYDAGRLGSPQAGSRSIADFLWSRGTTHLDAVIISHADADHYNALPGVLERFSIGAVYVSPQMFADPSPALADLRAAIERGGVPIREIWAGDRLKTSGPARLEVLHPPRVGVTGGSDNAQSIVLLVELGGRRILLPGDLESPGIESVMDEVPIDVDVLMAPHHGSAGSDPAGFSRWCTPQWVVISGGRVTEETTAEAAYRSAGAAVLHTARQGAIHVTLDAAGEVLVRPWRSPP